MREVATCPHFPPEPPLARKKRLQVPTAFFALLFLLVTYALVSGRAILNPDHSYSLWSVPRLISVAAGALLFWIALRLLDFWKHRPIPALAMRLLMLVVPVSVAMLCARLVIDQIAFGDTRPATNVRWVLVWMGYFTASLTAAVAIHLYLRIEQLSQASSAPVDDMGRSRGDPPAEESLWVQRQGGTVKVPLESIEWVEAEGNYVRIHAGEASGLIRAPLTAMEARLGTVEFLRVHRSIICRTSAIRAVKRRRTGAMLAQLGSGAEVPIGRTYGNRIKALRETFPSA